MNKEILKETAALLLSKGKGILAADESNNTANKRLAEYCDGEITTETRRQYREMLLETPYLEKFVSGVILYDETFWQNNSNDQTFVSSLQDRGILPGIKVDTGTREFPGLVGELITNGLDDLEDRVKKYAEAGAKFTKWRAVFTIDEDKGLPTDLAISENINDLVQYAKTVQKYNLVSIVEPEVLLLGKHNIQTSYEVTKKVVSTLFETLKKIDIYLPGLILKTSMVINGNQNADEASPQEVAEYTIKMLRESVPAEVGGVVFLSGGQTPVEATAHFDAIAKEEPLPWELAFSYARALQDPALQIWAGKIENLEAARSAFRDRLDMNHLADSGKYKVEFEWLD
jgi:fructose-bisphosphate aldolase, class I